MKVNRNFTVFLCVIAVAGLVGSEREGATTTRTLQISEGNKAGRDGKTRSGHSQKALNAAALARTQREQNPVQRS